MGSRFWISGVELGMLRAFAKQENESDINKLLDKIENNQYMCEKEEFEEKFDEMINIKNPKKVKISKK